MAQPNIEQELAKLKGLDQNTEWPEPKPEEKQIKATIVQEDKPRIDDHPEREKMEEAVKKTASEIVAATASNLRRQEDERRSKVQQAMQASQPRTQTNQPQADGGTIVASNLAPQVGTDNIDLRRGTVDIRRLTKIPPETVPQFATLLTIEEIRGNPDADVYGTWARNVLNLSRSSDGWGMNKVIEMQGASVPGVRPQRQEPKAPNILARNLYDRNWKEKAENE